VVGSVSSIYSVAIVLCEELAIEGAVLDGLKNMMTFDFFGSGEVGEGVGDFEDAVVGAGGEVHLLHGLFEVALAFGIEGAVFADVFRVHGGVGGVAVRCGEAEAGLR